MVLLMGPTTTYEGITNESRYFDDSVDYELMLETFENTLESSPGNTVLLNCKGSLLFNLHRYMDATYCFNTVLRNNPDNLMAVIYKGRIYFTIEEYHAAIAWFDRALDLCPGNPQVLIAKAESLRRIGKYENAIKCYDEMLAVKADNYHVQDRRKDAIKILELRKQILLNC